MRGFYTALVFIFMISTSFYKAPEHSENSPISISKVSTVTEKPIKISTEKSGVSISQEIYNSLSFKNQQMLNFEVFAKAFLGFEKLKAAGKLPAETKILTVCDFSLSSTVKRLWVIDVAEKKILFNSLVAHGKNTGEEFATRFSNTESSYQSSMGFYVTDATYQGGNGYSLKLLGMDKGYNDAALQRAVVMHGADYVSEEFIAVHKRIGRSWGCPAVPQALAKPIINTIKGKNCLFIYYPDEKYLASSEWLKA